MKNKVLAILVASAAALGSAIFATPAHAVQQDVQVEVTVQPTIFLRTFNQVKLQITQGDLGATDKDFNSTATTDGTTLISKLKPSNISAGTALTVKKNVKELFAVFSNSAKGVTVTVTPVIDILTSTSGDQSSVKLKTITVNNPSGTPTFNTPLVGGVDLDFDLTNSSGAGTYTGGSIRVEALATP